jgi:hypothetical protein
MTSKIQGKAGRLDLVIEQGATFALELTWRDSAGGVIDLTDYAAAWQIRENIDDVDPIYSADSDTGDPDGGGVSITPEEGRITIVLVPETTASFDFAEALYDLELTAPGGIVTRLLSGTVELSREVTRG